VEALGQTDAAKVARTGQLAVLEARKGPVNCFAFSPDGSLLAVSTGHPQLGMDFQLWDLRTGKVKFDLDVSSRVGAVCFSPDGTKLAAGCDDHAVWMFDTQSGRMTNKYPFHAYEVTTVAFAPDGRWLVSGSMGGFQGDKGFFLWPVGGPRVGPPSF